LTGAFEDAWESATIMATTKRVILGEESCMAAGVVACCDVENWM
jgi:hypothetical protein